MKDYTGMIRGNRVEKQYRKLIGITIQRREMEEMGRGLTHEGLTTTFEECFRQYQEEGILKICRVCNLDHNLIKRIAMRDTA